MPTEPSPAPALPAPRFRRILLPTAFSELSRRAAPYVRALAAAHSAEVHVLHVVPSETLTPEPTAMALGSALAPDPTAAMNDSLEGVRRFAGEQLPGLGAVPACVIGPPAREIAEYARRQQIDLIVMGTHADGMLKRVIFGSVSKAVLEHAPCPVLLVPVPDAARA